MSELPDIAIIGLAGCYAGAGDARRFWQNILDKVDAVADADDAWTGPYLDAENHAQRNDRTYTRRGGFLRDLAMIDPLEYGVMPNQIDGGEPDHLLALKHAGDALADAGYRERPFDCERAGVVLGRGTYTNRGQTSALYHAMFMDEMLSVVARLRPDLTPSDLTELRAGLKKQLPPYGGELVGQLTPNVITGLIANRLNLMGPNYIVDAACASSLIAFDQAVRELASGRCDLMLAGGVHAHTPAQLYVQFSQINALARGQLRPFQKGHSGTLLGEGVGVMVLKRLADAERDGDRIYAVAKGTGIASDGRAKGLLTPRLEGEMLAMRRAYQSSGIDPATIDLVEAHGTGTEIGDKTEIEALAQLFGGRGPGPQIAVGSVKSMIGHCLPASGSASLIKTVLALHHQVLPPTLCDEPDPVYGLEKTPLYINTETRPWIHGKAHPRRAGVNAFGFGGINAHVILEEYRGPKKTQVQVMHRPAPSELVTLAAASREALVALAQSTATRLNGDRPATLSQIAKASSAHVIGEHRLAIVADNEADLAKKLAQAIDKLGRADARAFKMRSGLFYGTGAAPGKVCFLYPGEGAQYPDMLADLCLHFPQVRDWFDFLETTAARNGTEPRAPILFPASSGLTPEARAALEARLFEVDIAAESVFAASMGLQALLDDLAIEPDAMLGHSTGENTALVACKVRRFGEREEMAESIRELDVIFRALDAAGRIANGTLLTIGALRPELRAVLLAGADGMQVAMDNCPNQLVMFGSPQAADALRQRLSGEGAICQALPFGRAYHTPLFKPMADAYREYLRPFDIGRGRTPLYSASSVGVFPDEPAAIRELAARQWERPVRFTDTVQRLYDEGFRVFVEVGPSGNLTSFVNDILRGRDDVVAVSCNSRRKPGVQVLQQMLAQLFAAGVAFKPAALYAHRELADIDLLGEPAGAAPRRKMAIKLQMPGVKITDEMSRRFAQLTVVLPAPTAGPSMPIDAVVADPRLEALQSHFSLMQEFLDSQARMLGLTGAAPATGDAHPLPLFAQPIMPSPAGVLQTRFTDNHLAFPLLGDILEHSSDRLVATRHFDASSDVFLQDHALGGAPSRSEPGLRGLMVIPFTFSMELVAQAALALAGEQLCVIGMSELRGHRWLSLDDGTLDLRIVAERVLAGENVQIRVRVFMPGASGPAGGALVFEGHVELAETRTSAPAAIDWPSAAAHPPRFSPPERLYGEGLFHGPRLQGVTRLRRWATDAIEADLLVLPSDDYFADAPSARLLTDAAVIDAVGQLAAYWLFEQFGSQFYCFPFRVGRYRQYVDVLPAGTPLVCRGALRLVADLRLEGQFDVMDAQGRLLLRLEEWEDRKFEIPPVFHRFHRFPQEEFISVAAAAPDGVLLRRVPAFDEGFMDASYGIWLRVLAHAALSARERALFYALPSTSKRREEWLLGRLAAKDAVRLWARGEHGIELAPADIEILADEKGAPRVHARLPGDATPGISISHSRGHAIAALVAPGTAVGVDLQYIDRVRAEDLVGVGLGPDEARLVMQAPDADRVRVAAALWCAKEAAAKALGRGLEGRPLEYRVVDSRLALDSDRESGTGYAEIAQGAHRLRVGLRFEDRAIIGICQIPLTSPTPSPVSLQPA